MPPDRVVEIAERLAATEADELVLADTIGVATPTQVRSLLERVGALGKPVGGHFHNTRNTGYANAYAALEAGVSVLDASTSAVSAAARSRPRPPETSRPRISSISSKARGSRRVSTSRR